MPLHIRADPGDIAPAVVLVGDPGRAHRAAGMIEGAVCYNDNRGLVGYSGRFAGKRVSVQTTGMGGPSTAIVVEELADLGASVLIRAGTCGAIADRVNVLDLVVATASVPMDGATRQYVQGDPFAPVADFDVTAALVAAARDTGHPFHTGLYVSEDAFYRQPDDWRKWRARGVLAAEMEAATLFTVALHRGLRAGAICLAVDRAGERESWADDSGIAAGTTVMLDAAFRAAAALTRKG